jgi:hypothetical protein
VFSISWKLTYFFSRIGLPTIVKNCTINNQTEHTVDIQCLPGYNGGLPQVFVLELVSTKTGKLR